MWNKNTQEKLNTSQSRFSITFQDKLEFKTYIKLYYSNKFSVYVQYLYLKSDYYLKIIK